MNGPDFRSGSVRNRQAMRDLEAFAWAPRPGVSLRSLVSATLVSVLLLGFLYALFVVGSK
jgi:hypothetical protein